MAVDVSVFSLAICLLLMVLPFMAMRFLRLPETTGLVIATVRMVVQLSLVGFFLKYLFQLNNPWLNVLWLAVMVMVATGAILNKSPLDTKRFFLTAFFSFFLAVSFVTIYVNLFVLRLGNVLDAKYIIAIGGMLLGNSLRGNIVGIGNFYRDIHRNQQRYRYRLSLGATFQEALLPYVRQSFASAIEPTISTMATTGIVSLPGMMTGQILGGSIPVVAIKYQIVIMIAIIATITLSVSLSLLLTIRKTFDKRGALCDSVG